MNILLPIVVAILYELRILISSNNFLVKDRNGKHPSGLVLGEVIRDIAAKLKAPDPTKGGGHKGIGIYTEITSEQMTDYLNEAKRIVDGEVKQADKRKWKIMQEQELARIEA